MTIGVKLLLSPITYSQYKFNFFLQNKNLLKNFFLNPHILIEFYKKIGINPIYSLLGNMIQIPRFFF